MRADGSPSSLRDAFGRGWRELALYVAAGLVYVASGLAVVEFLFSWAVAAAYVVLCVAVLPALVRTRGRGPTR